MEQFSSHSKVSNMEILLSAIVFLYKAFLAQFDFSFEFSENVFQNLHRFPELCFSETIGWISAIHCLPSLNHDR